MFSQMNNDDVFGFLSLNWFLLCFTPQVCVIQIFPDMLSTCNSWLRVYGAPYWRGHNVNKLSTENLFEFFKPNRSIFG